MSEPQRTPPTYELRVPRSNPSARRVMVSGRIVAELSEAQVEALGLEAGNAFTDEVAAQVAQAAADRKAERVAMTLLARRAFSTHEMRARLIKRGFDERTANNVVQTLADAGWLDDAQYAEQLAASVLEHRPATKTFLADKLRERGVPDAVVERTIADALADRDIEGEAEMFARRKLKTMRGLPNDMVARRLQGMLARRGFDEEAVLEMLRRLKLVE